MRRFRPGHLFPIALAAATLTPSRAMAKDPDEDVQIRALVVGISDFQNFSKEQDLRYAEADAKLFADTLTTSLSGAVRNRDIHLLLGKAATRQAVLTELDEVLGEADDNDVVILYFSTHGMLDNGQGYLATWDTQPNERLPFTALPMRNIELEVGQTRAQHVLIFTDACHSAAMGYTGGKGAPVNEINQAIGSMAQAGPSFFNMASSLVRQESLEGPEYCGGHGAFTCQLSNALKGRADMNKDGLVTLAELSVRVPAMVYNITDQKQYPEVKGSYDQSMILSVVVAPTKAETSKDPKREAKEPSRTEEQGGDEEEDAQEDAAALALEPKPPAPELPDDTRGELHVDPLPTPSAWSRPTGLTMTAIGGVSLLGGAVLGGVTLLQRRDFLDGDLEEFVDVERASGVTDAQTRINRQAGWSYGLLGLGAALGAGGGVLLWTGRF